MPRAEVTLKVAQIAAGFTGGVWGQNNWFSLKALTQKE